MKKYYMYNWDETKELFIGEFQNDEAFWEHYWANEIEIKSKQIALDRQDTTWHMVGY